MFRKNFEELPSGHDDVFVAGGDGVAGDELQHHGGPFWIFGLGARELSGGPDESEDLFVFPIEIDEFAH